MSLPMSTPIRPSLPMNKILPPPALALALVTLAALPGNAAAPAAAAAPAPASAPVATSTGTAPTKEDAFQKLADFAQVDLSLPASPAFAVLGLSPDKVERPTTLRTLAATALRSLGPDGKVVKGVAFDVNPALLVAPHWITAGTGYAGSTPEEDLSPKHYIKRAVTRTTLSLATTDADSSGASKLAWGLRLGLIDEADPGLFYQKTVECLQAHPPAPIPAHRVTGSVPASDDLEKCLDKAKDSPAVLSSKPLWARFSLYAGYGQSWYSKSGSLTDHVPDVKTFWLTTSYGLAGNETTIENSPGTMRTLIQGYLERRLDDRTPDPNNADALLNQNSTQGIVRLKTGDGKWHGFAEVGLSKVRFGNSTTENVHHYALGYELNLGHLLSMNAKGMDSWIQIASVHERGFADGKDKTGVALSLKFGEPFLDLPGSAAAKK
jgi:hypothetical protein